MKNLIFLLIGVIFGITMFKSEAASWFRIYEMFQFQSFHMYGIIGSALLIGAVGIQVIKRLDLKSFSGETIELAPKTKGFNRYMFGGIIFGLGWALVGACPGPMFSLLGAGFGSIAVVILFSVLGTLVYGMVMKKLPN
ncbi:MAG: YeeE/YedE thiosulfate transporter family protein [Bacteroidetes bacterium]|nr:YeeE/YedE thiosulfate transporter family protein [Bacteroidota bacterium]MDA1116328.1 YeeE/YedE thiosulfate transporter family protein [Bacteroidota bacterium]